MKERVIDFSDIEVGDVLDIRLKEYGVIIGNAKIYEYDAADDSYYIPAIEYWLFQSAVESIILKDRTRTFEPGIYISKDYAESPWTAIIWRLDGRGNWTSTVPMVYTHPFEAYAAGWQDKLVRFVQEVDSE